jgi:tetratricopeptide (TPR) repeat protein
MRSIKIIILLLISIKCFTQSIDLKLKTDIKTLKLENQFYKFKNSITIEISKINSLIQDSLNAVLDRLNFDLKNDSLIYLSAKYYILLNKPEKALELIEKCISLNNNYSDYFWFRGFCKESLTSDKINNFSAFDIMQDYNNALKLDSTNENALNDRGLLYMQLGFNNLGKKDIVQLVSIHPDWATGHSNIAKIYSNENELDKAIFHYKKAIEIDPDLPLFYNNLAMVYLKKSDIENAMHYFDKAIEKDKFYFNAYRNKADLYSRIGKKSLACDELKKAMELGDDKSEYYFKRDCH